MLGAALFAFPALAAGDVTEITLLHDTQFSGDFGDESLNLAHYAALVNRIRSSKPNVLWVGGGDDLASSALSSLFLGEHMVDALNAAGLDFDTFGNHEFDYGPENLAARMAQSKFTWVSANVVDRATGNAFAAAQGGARYAIVDLGGVKVGITGIALGATATASKPGPGVLVLDPEEALRGLVPVMRAAGADIVVVLSHEQAAVTERLAESVPGVDVFIGDHEQATLPQPKVIGNAIVSRVGGGFDYLGELTLRVADGKIVDWEFTLHDLKALIAEGRLYPDRATQRVIQEYEAKAPHALQEEIGRTATPLDARIDVVRARESALGNFFADAMRRWADADAALINGGGLRGNQVYGPGTLTHKDIFEIMPFGNFAVKLRLSGADLLAALEHGVAAVEMLEGRFPQVSGVAFAFDPSRPAGSRIVEATINGRPIDPEATYTLATYDFLADGGSGYSMFVNAERVIPARSGELVTTIVIEAIREAGTIAPVEEGRIREVGGD